MHAGGPVYEPDDVVAGAGSSPSAPAAQGSRPSLPRVLRRGRHGGAFPAVRRRRPAVEYRCDKIKTIVDELDREKVETPREGLDMMCVADLGCWVRSTSVLTEQFLPSQNPQ